MLNDQLSPEIILLNEIQQFLQSAVHDLRAAQRRSAIAAELLVQSGAEHEREELAAQISQGFARTEMLLAAIGNYSNALTPHRYSRTEFPVGRAIRFALANLDKEIRETGAMINVAQDLPDVTADRDRVAELFQHLIGNSLKFRGPEPPVIDIAAKSTPEGWIFSVSDNGIGIAAKYRDRLFIPFRRLQGPEVQGAGLGLAISKKIVEAHGGRIWIELREGPGVTVCFMLPSGDGD